jgi:hypothetical protein
LYSLGDKLGKFLFKFKDKIPRPNPDFYIGLQKKDKKDDDNNNPKSLQYLASQSLIKHNPAVADELLNNTNIDPWEIVRDGRGGRRKTRVRIKKTRAINKKQKTRKSRRR